ncbi:hypothetical protein MKW98_005636 [Papaver atlanticum]|uniref:Uncharacterized protein n=1 Tax=Papaver atlanticum TaxID=357466 RepID=A0AAD4STZ0_9MAGN|nr:hypothetical protein MKW98_005636 [Papaver atlanticum]
MDSENSTDTYSSLLENVRTIENMYKLFQNPSLTLQEDSRIGLKRVIDDFAQQTIRSQVKTFEEEYFKSPPKKCPNCGKMKKAGRQVVIAIDAAYFGNHPQQPSPTQLVSHSMKDGHPRIQQESVAIVPKFQSGQETVNALERQSKWEDIRYAQEQKSSQKKNQTQHRISTPPLQLSGKVGYGGSKEVGPCRQKYSNFSSDVTLAPTLMQFDTESTFSDSASSSASTTPSAIYSGSSSCNEREPHPRRRMLDHRRRCRSISRSRSPSEDYSYNSSRSASCSRSPDEVYSHRRSRDSNVHPSNHSTDKMGWFRRIKNKLGGMFHHQDDHHHHPRNNTDVCKLHHKSKVQMVRKNKRRTQVKNRRDFKHQGHLRMLFGGFISYLWGSNKSKPSTADKRRLERTVTGKRKLVVKKLHWWQKIHRRGLSNRGKSHKLGFNTKYP